MDKLLDSGLDINLLDKVGCVLIIYRCWCLRNPIWEGIVNFGGLLIQDGFTPLHKAIIGKKEAVISHLLRKGANPHVRDRVSTLQAQTLLVNCCSINFQRLKYSLGSDNFWSNVRCYHIFLVPGEPECFFLSMLALNQVYPCAGWSDTIALCCSSRCPADCEVTD